EGGGRRDPIAESLRAPARPDHRPRRLARDRSRAAASPRRARAALRAERDPAGAGGLLQGLAHSHPEGPHRRRRRRRPGGRGPRANLGGLRARLTSPFDERAAHRKLALARGARQRQGMRTRLFAPVLDLAPLSLIALAACAASRAPAPVAAAPSVTASSPVVEVSAAPTPDHAVARSAVPEG